MSVKEDMKGEEYAGLVHTGDYIDMYALRESSKGLCDLAPQVNLAKSNATSLHKY